MDTRAFALLEAMIGGTLLGALSLFVVTSFQQESRHRRDIASGTAFHQVEEHIRSEIAKRVHNYVKVNSPNCQPSSFEAALNTDLPSGIRARLVDATYVNQLAYSVKAKAKAALERCLSAQSHTLGTNFSQERGFYFCLSLTAQTGTTPSASFDILGMQPLFVEFFFSPQDVQSSARLSCEEFASASIPTVSSLIYSINWREQKGGEKSYVGAITIAN